MTAESNQEVITEARLKSALKAYQEESLEVFREAIDYADCPVQTYALFLALPEKGSTSLSQVNHLFRKLSQASVSRNVALLCGKSRLRVGGGWALADLSEDPQDRRYKVLMLSKEGRELREKMHGRAYALMNRILGRA